MERRMAVKTSLWVTVKENVEHPDHEGVVGDLVRNRDTGHYQLLEYDGTIDNYRPHFVPHAWARREDPTPSFRDERDEVTGRDVVRQAHAKARETDDGYRPPDTSTNALRKNDATT